MTSIFSRSRKYLQNEIPSLFEQSKALAGRGSQRTIRLLEKVASDYRRVAGIFKFQTSSFPVEASRILNQITGYEDCEKLRQVVKTADEHFQRVKNEMRQSRLELDSAIQLRSQCQKELNALLQRKQSWLDEDLMRFTELYRKEMKLEQKEQDAKTTNELLEKEVDNAHQALMNALRERYQEEQLWSDKIRRLSTFGTFSLMGLNILLFLVIQLYVEPRKRQKFIGSFERTVSARLANLREEISEDIEKKLAITKMESSSTTPRDFLESPVAHAAAPIHSYAAAPIDWVGAGKGIVVGASAFLLLQLLTNFVMQ